jgi:hypothetical protein
MNRVRQLPGHCEGTIDRIMPLDDQDAARAYARVAPHAHPGHVQLRPTRSTSGALALRRGQICIAASMLSLRAGRAVAGLAQPPLFRGRCATGLGPGATALTSAASATFRWLIQA